MTVLEGRFDALHLDRTVVADRLSPGSGSQQTQPLHTAGARPCDLVGHTS